MQTQRTYWNRVGFIKVQLDDGKLHQFGGENELFDMKFDGVKYGDFYSTFTCSILGLSRDSINLLTVWDAGRAVKKRRMIEVYAGYTSNGNDLATPIFKGFILDAIPTQPPERWLNFNCITAFDKDDIVSGVPTMVSSSRKSILKRIAEISGLEYNDSSWQLGKDNVNETYKFKFNGIKKNQLGHEFSKVFNCRVINQNGVIVATSRRGWLKIPENKDLIRNVNTRTGLLNIGGIDCVGAKIVNRLDNGFSLLSWVDLQSEMIPNAGESKYYVTSMHHTGHLRGKKWQTEVELIRYGAKI